MATKPTWHPKLAKYRASVEKRTKVRDVFVEASQEIQCINTGSTVLNMLIGGSRLKNGKFLCPGWAKGSINEIFGRESSGKSTLALTALGHAVEAGGCGLYIDLECAVKDHYAVKLGADFRSPDLGGSGAALRAQPRTFEETEALTVNAALQGIDIVVIDSVAALVSGREMKRDVSDAKQKQGVAEVPRLMSTFLPKLQRIIAETGTVVLFLNQQRDKIGAFGHLEETIKSTTGGNTLKFFASTRVLLKPKMSVKAKIWNPLINEKEDVYISTDVEVKMVKNKIDAKQGHSGLITIRYGTGVDELRTMLTVAERYNIINKIRNKQKREVFAFKSPKDSHVIEAIGSEKFRLEMSKQPEYLNEVIELARNKIIEGYRMLDDEELAALAEDAVTSHEHDDSDNNDDSEYDDPGEPEIQDYGDLVDSNAIDVEQLGS